MSNATLDAVVASSSVITCDASQRRCIPLAALRQIPEVEVLVDGFVASWHPSFASIESWRWHRIPFDKPLIISPLDDSSELCSGFSFAVQGQDISLVGVSFTHREPLTLCKVAVTFPFEDGESGQPSSRCCDGAASNAKGSTRAGPGSCVQSPRRRVAGTRRPRLH